MRLILTFLVAVLVGIENSFQNLDTDEEHDTKCSIHASDQTTSEVDYDNSNSKASGAVVKCHPNDMSISLPKSSLVSVDRADLRLLDSNCIATENSTHFVLTTTLIGCGTLSRHTNSSVIYSNIVRNVHDPTAVITRSPEIQISFRCHYSKHGSASVGPIHGGGSTYINKAASDYYESDKDLCWNNRFPSYRRRSTCPTESAVFASNRQGDEKVEHE